MTSDLYRVMAIDYGDVRIGIALSDLTRTIANGYENYSRISLDKDMEHLISIAKTNNVKVVVFGLPFNMDGTESNQTIKTKDFATMFEEKSNLKVVFQDERLTSKIAERVLIDADMSRNKRKNVLDKLSATIILQDYLN